MKHLMCLTVLAGLATASNADTITVCLDGSCDYTDIQEAINAASDGDVIEIAAGTYYPPATIGMNGKSVALRGEVGKGAVPITVVDGQGKQRVFECDDLEGPQTLFENLYITRGQSSVQNGGGVYCNQSSPTFVKCVFDGNSANSGGGMYCVSSSPVLTDCLFINNTALSSGPGMANDKDCHPFLTNCTFLNNYGGYGGGMYNINYCSPVLNGCVFSGNSGGRGGGMYNYRYCNPVLTDCVFTGNSANIGGGMRNAEYCVPILKNCTFVHNVANQYGGGMYNYQSSPVLENCTVCDNSPAQIDGTWTDASDNYISCHCPQECQADLNCDERVDSADLGLLIAKWATSDRECDLDGDGEVRAGDLGLLLGTWGLCP